MIPKLETCVHAVEAGCEAAVVLDGRVPHAMLLEFFTSRGAGTLIRLPRRNLNADERLCEALAGLVEGAALAAGMEPQAGLVEGAALAAGMEPEAGPGP